MRFRVFLGGWRLEKFMIKSELEGSALRDINGMHRLIASINIASTKTIWMILHCSKKFSSTKSILCIGHRRRAYRGTMLLRGLLSLFYLLNSKFKNAFSIPEPQSLRGTWMCISQVHRHTVQNYFNQIELHAAYLICTSSHFSPATRENARFR